MSKNLKDHRQIGKELDLFSFHEYAPGAVFWHPKGWFIYQKIVNLLRSILDKANYQEIKTPVMIKNELFKKSGHWEHFGEHNMFNMPIYEPEEIKEIDKNREKAIKEGKIYMIGSLAYPRVNYSLKPMNCPESAIVYNFRRRSYKELPLKFSQFDILHRRELSGVIGGLFRLREFSIDDAHIFCMDKQVQQEVLELLEQIQSFYKLFNLKLRFYLSTKPDKALELPDFPNLWNDAEKDLKTALDLKKIKYDIKEKDGAFYGPKIDFHMTDSQGRDWQLATVQIDFQQPRSLDVKFTNEKGEEEYAVMVHRALLGSVERFIGILIEQYQGAFPLWLSPTQVTVLSVSDKNNDTAKKVYEQLVKAGIRTELNIDNKTLGNKIREATLQKIPYMIIIGDKESDKRVSVRTREGKDLGQIDLYKFIESLQEKIEKFQ